MKKQNHKVLNQLWERACAKTRLLKLPSHKQMRVTATHTEVRVTDTGMATAKTTTLTLPSSRIGDTTASHRADLTAAIK